MRILLLSVGKRMPRWVDEGFAEYAKRLPPACSLDLKEIEPAQRGRRQTKVKIQSQTRRWRTEEGARLLKALPTSARAVALDGRGQSWSTEQLAIRLSAWLSDGRDVALLVGGPDGLADACLDRADEKWSLSRLTFPHPLVRIIVAEQVYRAWSVLQGHPYHRGGEPG